MNNPPETSTPRTDAEPKKWWGDNRPGMSAEYVASDFARTLERELAASNAKLAEWRDVAKELARLAGAVRATSFTIECDSINGRAWFDLQAEYLTHFNTLNTTEK